MINEPKNITELKRFSEKIGNNLDWIQGAGGNTSLKEEGIIWIKASGCWLSSSLTDNIFIPVNHSEALDSISKANLPQIKSQIQGELRPSIETSLHALMPHKFVFHTHPVNLISIAVLKEGRNYLNKIFSDFNWEWVPYAKPGIDLAKEVKRIMHKDLDIIVLANHGLVVGAETAHDAFELLINIEGRIIRNLRSVVKPSKEDLLLLLEESKYRICKYDVANDIANDDLALNIVKIGTLYPDHIVFLGADPMQIVSIEELEHLISTPDYIKKNPVVIVRNSGVIVHSDISENAEVMLYCLGSILLRINFDEKISYLSQANEMELTGWDAEKYRKSIEK
jgi:rhamnose utilization protein RhaD (predicted bifunctional aldolase and dehydrogenase)